MADDRITTEELRGIFGDRMPMEAILVLTDQTITTNLARQKLRELAAPREDMPAPELKYVNRTAGRYWRIAWSSSWAHRHPWSLSGRIAPYIGVVQNDSGTVVLRTLGPIALMSVEVGAALKGEK